MSLREGGRKSLGIGAFALLILAIIVHTADLATRLNGQTFGFLHPIIILYILIALFASLILKGTGETALDKLIQGTKTQHRLAKYLIISLIAYSIPFVNYIFYYFPSLAQFSFFGTTIKMIVSMAIIFAPIWVLYIMYVEPTKLTGTIGGIYLLLWIILILSTFWQPIQEQKHDLPIEGVMPGYTLGYMTEKIVSTTQYIASEAKEMPHEITEEIREGVYIAEHGIDPKQAEINKANQKTLGLNMGPPQTTTVAFTDMPLTVHTKLQGAAIIEPISAIFGCTATNDHIQGKIFPTNQMTIQKEQTEEIDCIFEPGQLDKGMHKITISADFNFESISYIQTFFMPEQTLTELRKKGEDPLAGTSQPRATTTKGPVNVNIHAPQAPIPAAENKKITLGITLLNTGQGKIKKINEAIIYMPKGLELAEETGITQNYEKITCEDLLPEEQKTCDPEASEIYKVTQKALSNPQYKNIKTGREFRLYLQEYDKDKLTGKTPIKPASFHTTIRYDYLLEKSTTVHVKEPEAPEI